MIKKVQIFLYLIFFHLMASSQTIIKVKGSYVLINTAERIGEINEKIYVYRGSSATQVKIGRIKILKFQGTQTAGQIIYEKSDNKISVGDFVLQKNEDLNKSTNNINTIQKTFDLLIEWNPPNGMGVKFLLRSKIGYFLGTNVSLLSPDVKLYNWSQDRAENFYNSRFSGLTDAEWYGFNGGVLFSISENQIYSYFGYGYIGFKQYRKYHDSTFTVLENDYYISDGAVSKNKNDFLFGFIYVFKPYPVLFNLGYSTGLKNVSIGIGYGMPVP